MRSYYEAVTTKTDIRFLTNEQISAIVEGLIKVCGRIRERDRQSIEDFPDLYDKNYYSGRKHGDTAAVYSGFASTVQVPDMSIISVPYGRNHYQPELHSDTAVIQLYNETAGRPLKS